MKKERLIFLIILGLIFVIILNNSFLNKEIDSEKDKECLVSAGYNWNETIQACIREREINSSEKRKAVKIASETINRRESLTLLTVLKKECEGCYDVFFTYENKIPFVISLKNWEANKEVTFCTEESRTADVCVSLYDPVCGCTYKDECSTYSNNCVACLNDSVQYYFKGEC